MNDKKNERILCIDTSGDRCAVALGGSNTGLESVSVLNRPNIHSEALAELTGQVLENASLSPKEIDAVAVVSGPGSFTGLRIGMSFAKGYAFGLGIPIMAVTAFEAIAGGYAKCVAEGSEIYVLLDARRGELFFQSFRKVKEDAGTVGVQGEGEPSIIKIENVKELIKAGGIPVFYGVESMLRKIKNETGMEVKTGYPDPEAICGIASSRYRQGIFDDIHRLVPFYMRSFAGIM